MRHPMQLERTEKGNAVVSWTGGKDGCYSCYKAMAEGYHVTYLLHFRNVNKVGSHEINPQIIQAQSKALGIPLLQRSFSSYEQEFKRAISDLRAQGESIDGAIFGHIETHKMLVERICRDMNLDQIMPLWKQDSAKILKEIINSGFEVLVVSVKDGLLGGEWLGRRIDESFIHDLRDLNPSINPCGENGEFHTLVTDGPIFKKKIKIFASGHSLREGYWFLDAGEFALLDK